MKTTIDVSDHLLEKAKRAAKQQGVSLRVLFERGLEMALEPPVTPPADVWPDLTYTPRKPGTLVPAEHWRDSVNEVPGWQSQ